MECRKFYAERVLTFFASYPFGYGRGAVSYFICKVSYNLIYKNKFSAPRFLFCVHTYKQLNNKQL